MACEKHGGLYHTNCLACDRDVASDCSGADDRQSDVERSENPKRSGDIRVRRFAGFTDEHLSHVYSDIMYELRYRRQRDKREPMSDNQGEQVADLAAPRSAGAEAAELTELYKVFRRNMEAAERQGDETDSESISIIKTMEANIWNRAATQVRFSMSRVLAAGASRVGTREAEAG